MNRETLIDAMPREWTTYAIRQHLADALLPVVAAALDAAEARGRAEVAAKVESLADHITALDVSTVKAPGLVDRLRAIVAGATRSHP
jgi:hypothetical protein